MSVIEKAVAILRSSKPGEVIDDDRVTEHSVSYQKTRAGKVNTKNLVCELDFDALKQSGYITGGNDNTQFAEEYRIIKRPLLANAFGKGAAPIANGNLIMITSSIPGEGKTFTSMNLALSIALERDTTVLLVDIDVLSPRLSKLFGLENQPGLLDVVNNPGMTLSDVIINTDNPKLRLIPAGQGHEHSTEILASERMAMLCEELSQRYSDRIIIIDSPPVLSTNEANILSRKVGQIVFVIEQNRTTQANVKEALSQFDDNSVIGIVMNKSRTNNSSSYYGYYY